MGQAIFYFTLFYKFWSKKLFNYLNSFPTNISVECFLLAFMHYTIIPNFKKVYICVTFHCDVRSAWTLYSCRKCLKNY